MPKMAIDMNAADIVLRTDEIFEFLLK